MRTKRHYNAVRMSVNASPTTTTGDLGSHHLRHWGVASALLIALITIHADLALVAEGAGGRQSGGINKSRNDLTSTAPNKDGMAAIDLDNQSPPKPMLVPDPDETGRDPLISGKVKHVRLSKEGFKSEEDAFIRTRLFLRNQTRLQSKRERELRYLNMHANLLMENGFQSELVDRLKKVKDETKLILGNLRGNNRRNKGHRGKRSVDDDAVKEREEEETEAVKAATAVKAAAARVKAVKATKDEKEKDDDDELNHARRIKNEDVTRSVPDRKRNKGRKGGKREEEQEKKGRDET